MVRIEIKLNLDREFYPILEKVETKLYKEIHEHSMVLFADFEDDLKHIEADSKKILARIKEIDELCDKVNLPSEVIEQLERSAA